jgi:hypothetical protein
VYSAHSPRDHDLADWAQNTCSKRLSCYLRAKTKFDKGSDDMKTKTILAVLALSLAPTFAYASCRDGAHQASSCKAGTAWDADAGACVATNA